MHRLFAVMLTVLIVAACAAPGTPEPVAQRYRCEAGIEFSARFSGNSVTLDSSRGYELLFSDAAPVPSPPNPNSYRNPRMSAEFKLGNDSREAVLRYPLLPLVVRCVRDL